MTDDYFDFSSVSVADVIEFERLPERQQRIAFAAFALAAERRNAEQLRHAREESYEDGLAAGRSESVAGDVIPKDTVVQFLDRLQLFRQVIPTSDSRYPMLGEIIADMAKALE